MAKLLIGLIVILLGSSVQTAWAGVPEGFTFTSKESADVRSLLAGLLPVSARVNGSSFDIYVSTPEMLNSSENKDYPFGNIKTPTLVIRLWMIRWRSMRMRLPWRIEFPTLACFPCRMGAIYS
jgi:hypothetical protein